MNYTRDTAGRFSTLRHKLKRFSQYALFILIASVYVPISTVWVAKQAYETAYGYAETRFADTTYTATTTEVKDRRKELEEELRPKYEKALSVAIEEALIAEEKLLIEKKLEEVRAEKLQSPLP